MATKAEEIIRLAAKQKDDQENWSVKAASQVGFMATILQEVLGSPSDVRRLELESLYQEECVQGFDGTLISRKGCHFALGIKLGRTYEFEFQSTLFPAGDRLMVRTEPGDKNAIDVTDEEGVKKWALWVADSWLASQFADTINGSISNRLKKP